MSRTLPRVISCRGLDDIIVRPAGISACAMQFDMVTTRSVRLQGWRVPFRLRWRADRGMHCLVRRGAEHLLRRSIESNIEQDQMFDLHLTPDVTGAVAGRLTIECDGSRLDDEPDWDALQRHLLLNRGLFALTLAQSMFLQPAYPWKLDNVAMRLGIKPRLLQMTLFRDGTSFDSTLKRCQALRAVLTGYLSD